MGMDKQRASAQDASCQDIHNWSVKCCSSNDTGAYSFGHKKSQTIRSKSLVRQQTWAAAWWSCAEVPKQHACWGRQIRAESSTRATNSAWECALVLSTKKSRLPLANSAELPKVLSRRQSPAASAVSATSVRTASSMTTTSPNRAQIASKGRSGTMSSNVAIKKAWTTAKPPSASLTMVISTASRRRRAEILSRPVPKPRFR